MNKLFIKATCKFEQHNKSIITGYFRQNYINTALLSNNMKKWWLLLIIGALFLPAVFGFGLASDFLANDILELAPGAEYDYYINLQNGQSGSLFVNITVTSDNNIARLNSTNSVFEVPEKTYDVQIPLHISIPWYASEGKIFDVSYIAKPVTASGGLSFTVVLSRGFKVKVAKSGFVARGVLAHQKSLSDVTSNSVKKLNENKFELGGGLVAILAAGLLFALVWKRSGDISNKLFTSKQVVKEPQMDMSYSTLPEFYRVMASVDGGTFWNYIATYEQELSVWLAQASSPKFSKELMLSKTRKEFLQRLKNGLMR